MKKETHHKRTKELLSRQQHAYEMWNREYKFGIEGKLDKEMLLLSMHKCNEIDRILLKEMNFFPIGPHLEDE